MKKAFGYAATDASAPLAPFSFERRDTGPRDVRIEIDWCGVCHSDLHTVRGEWGNTIYPSLPGHEIIGRVVEVGAQVRKFSVGDLAGVGCLVDSCRTCSSCRSGLEQYCEKGFTGTYNGPEQGSGANTYGGYSNSIVVDEDYVLKVPANLDPAAAAPLLCAGITTYSPMRRWRVQPGHRVGVVGLGGLGHMGVKLARAMGAHVVLFTTSPGKIADGMALGAHEVVVSKDPQAMEAKRESLDFILNTVAAPHNLDPYLQSARARRRDGARRRAGGASSVTLGVQPHHEAAPDRGIADRRHRGNAGNAGFLRRTRNRLRDRDDSDPVDQRSLRADAAQRRALSLRHRHEKPEARGLSCEI